MNFVPGARRSRSSVSYTHLVLELLMQTAFTLYGSPPSGSINRTVTDELGIPVITVETFRGDEMEVRIEKHLEVTDFVLTYCGLS